MSMKLTIIGGPSIDFGRMEPTTMKEPKKKVKIAPGCKVRFDPFEGAFGYGIEACRGRVTGTIVDVYPKHQWFSVVYGEPKQRFSFKFCDIGERVKIIG